MARQFKQIIEEAGEFSMQQQGQSIRERMTLNLKEFADKVAAFNNLGEALYQGSNFAKLAEDLEEIASGAEAYTLRETADSPFDQVTIKRNMKELRGYTNEFKKVATEARALQERMTALYEDSGRVLGRYFEIKEFGQPDGMTTEPEKNEDELQINARPGVREGQLSEAKVHRFFVTRKKDNREFEYHVGGSYSKDAAMKVALEKHPSSEWVVKYGGLVNETAGTQAAVSNRLQRQKFGRRNEQYEVDENGMCKECGQPMEGCTCEENVGGEEEMCPGCNKPVSQCDCPGHVHEAEKWIGKAVNPAHKGYCTPMSKSTCTPRRKALARRFKKGIDKEAYLPQVREASTMSHKSLQDRIQNAEYGLSRARERVNSASGEEKIDAQKRVAELTARIADFRSRLAKTKSVKENVSPTGGRPAFKSMKLTKILEDVNNDYPKEDWVKLDVPMLKYDVALEFEKDLKKKGFDVRRHDWKERAAQGEEFSEFWVKKDDFDEANRYAVGAYPSYDNNARLEKS